MRNFEITEINQSGIFGFWISHCKNKKSPYFSKSKNKTKIVGKWELMILDDSFPCKNDEYCMAQCNNGVWIFILEKALAKMYTSYFDLNGGFTCNCLTDLTGAPTEYIEEGNE